MANTIPPEPGDTVTPESTAPAAAPAASAPVTPAPGSPIPAVPAVTYASLGDRTLAVVLDTLVLFALFWAVGMMLAPRFGGLTAEGFNLQGRPALIILSISSLLFLIYYVCFEWWFGSTLGKVVAGARVTSVDGGRIDVGRSVIRNLLRTVDFLAVYLLAALLVLLTKKRQRLGDMVAHTVVVKRDYPGLGRAVALLVLLALPIAAVAGTWSLRTPSTGEPAGPTATTSAMTTPGSSTGVAGPADGATTGAGGGAMMAPITDGPFTLGNLRAAEGPEGPDRATTTYKPGDSATLRFAVSGFDTSPGNGRVRISFSARDPFGVAMVKTVESVQQPSAGKTSFSAWARVSLPEYAWPGQYHLDLAVADLVANREVTTSVPFTVEGTPIEPSDTLILRNLRVTEGQDGPARASTTYRPGDTIWLSFDVVGFKSDADGTVRFKEEVSVASGDERSPRQQLLDINERFSYVPRRIGATNHLTLTGMSPGDYVMTLYFTDSIGEQQYEQAVRFAIQP